MSGSRWSRVGPLCAWAVAALLAVPAAARAQFSDPCAAHCGATLVATGIVAATGTVVTAARLTGGFSTQSQGIATWVTSFWLVVGSGVALGVNGERQERAVYSAAAGSAIGAAVGLGLGVFTDSSDRTRMLASTLIAAGAGALAGGVYGALTHEDFSGGAYTSMSVSFRF